MAIYKGLMASLESIEEREAPIMDETSEAGDVVDNAALETELLEVQEGGDEIASMNDEIEEAADAAESLESLRDSLISIQAKGGMDRHSAIFFNHAKEAIYSRLGMECRSEDFVSLESINEDSRQHVTRVALEDVKGKIKEIWAAIKKFIAQLWEKIKAFFGNINATAGQLAKRSAQLQVAVSKEFSGNGELTEQQQAKYGKSLAVDGKVNNLTDIANQLLNAYKEGMLENLASAYVSVAKSPDVTTTVEKTEKRLFIFKKKITEVVTGPNPAISNIVGKFTPNEFVKSQWNKGEGEYSATPALPGGGGFRRFSPASAEAADAFGFGLVAPESKDVKFTSDLLPKDGNAAKAIAVAIGRLAGRIQKSDRKFTSQLDELKKMLDAPPKEEDETATAKMKGYQTLFKDISSAATGFANYELRKGKEVLDLVSIAAGKKAAAEPAKEGEAAPAAPAAS